jgi:hypothetical protein
MINELPFGVVYLCGVNHWNVLVKDTRHLDKYGFACANFAGQYLKEQMHVG